VGRKEGGNIKWWKVTCLKERETEGTRGNLKKKGKEGRVKRRMERKNSNPPPKNST